MIQFLENHRKRGKFFSCIFFPLTVAFILVMQNNIQILLYVEKYSHHSNGNWPAIYIHRRGEGVTKMNPVSFLPFILFLRKIWYFFTTD